MQHFWINTLKLKTGFFFHKLFDKRDKFPFFIACMLHFESNIPSIISYGFTFSGFLRIVRCSLKLDKQVRPKRAKANAYKDSNILFEHHISNSKITIFYLERICLVKVFTLKYILPRPLKLQYEEVAENPILL